MSRGNALQQHGLPAFASGSLPPVDTLWAATLFQAPPDSVGAGLLANAVIGQINSA